MILSIENDHFTANIILHIGVKQKRIHLYKF